MVVQHGRVAGSPCTVRKPHDGFSATRRSTSARIARAVGGRIVLLRLAYLGITNAFALLRLLPGGIGTRTQKSWPSALSNRTRAPRLLTSH